MKKKLKTTFSQLSTGGFALIYMYGNRSFAVS